MTNIKKHSHHAEERGFGCIFQNIFPGISLLFVMLYSDISFFFFVKSCVIY